MVAANDPIIRVSNLTVGFGDRLVLNDLSLDVRRGEILGFVGASGAGKSVLTRTIIGLMPKRSGRIEVMGVDLHSAGEEERRNIERRWGVLFQHGALFSSLSVRENIQFPVRELMDLSDRVLDEMTYAKLTMVGLRPDVADRYPSQLSGGMIKRVALARALALDPEIVFLDEPTSGLDLEPVPERRLRAGRLRIDGRRAVDDVVADAVLRVRRRRLRAEEQREVRLVLAEERLR